MDLTYFSNIFSAFFSCLSLIFSSSYMQFILIFLILAYIFTLLARR